MHVSGYDWTYLWNSMWCVIITMATVGYGDFVPKTYLGRVITIMACIWGNFLISLMVISLTVSSEFTDPAHRKAFESVIRSTEQLDLRNKAALAITSLLRYNLTAHKFELTSTLRLRHLNEIRDRLKRF